MCKRLRRICKKNHIDYETNFEKHEILHFDYIHLLKFLLKMYKLDVLAELTGNVEIAITLDGSKLTNQLFHVTAGLKINRYLCSSPKIGYPFITNRCRNI